MAEDKSLAEEVFSEEGEESGSASPKWQVFVNDLSWGSKPVRATKRARELPAQLTYDIPENVIVQAKKPKNVFNDVIETHVLNALTKRYAHEVMHAQIWLLFSEDDVAQLEQ